MNQLENQQKENATTKQRILDINLSDGDYRKIAERAAIAEMSVEELIASFIGDLVDGTYSNGSDERMYAQHWYERCGFGDFYRNSFLHYLIDEYAVEEFVESWNSAEFKIVEEYWDQYLKWSTTEKHDKEKEILAVLDWHAKYITQK